MSSSGPLVVNHEECIVLVSIAVIRDKLGDGWHTRR